MALFVGRSPVEEHIRTKPEIQTACQNGPEDVAGARRASAGRPWSSVSQPLSRVLDGARAVPVRVTAIPLERRLPGASSNQPGQPGLDIDPGAFAAPRRPYSVLLPVGFTVPPALPPA